MSKFKRKKEREAEGAFDIEDIIREAKKHKITGILIPRKNADLVEVPDWIPMPKPILKILGTPGIPCGLITMVYGKRDSGKTTFSIEALASAQRENGIAVLIDTEHKFNFKRAELVGLDRNSLALVRAASIEQVFDKFVGIVNIIKNNPKMKNRKMVCVWDSLGATPTDAECDGKSKDFAMTAARVIKGGLRKVVRFIHDTKVAFVIINHSYTKMVSWGDPDQPYGGSGPEYHSALTLKFTKIGRVRPPKAAKESPFCGIRTKIECVKNHLGQPFAFGEVQIDGKGFVVDRDPTYVREYVEDAASDELPTEEGKGDGNGEESGDP